MLEKILNFFITKPKGMLDHALDEINSADQIVTANTSRRISKVSMFIVCKDGYYTTVLFSKNGENVMIKNGKEVQYYFNTSDEVSQIRKAIIEYYM